MEKKITELRKEVLDFALDMERQMRNNDSKTGWRDEDLEYLLERMTEEKRELEKAVERHERNYFSKTQAVSMKLIQRVVNEAADLANFAMMTAYRAKSRSQ